MLSDDTVRRSLLVTLGITVVGTAISMAVSVLCAYGLSRSRSLGHRFLLLVLVVTMFVNGGLIPTFLVVNGLGGFGKYWALILPSAVSVFNILVLRSFYSSTAAELIDAARMDGASEWRILWSVVLPTSRAVTAVISLFYAVGYWNTFFNAMLYLSADSQKWPLQMVLYEYVNRGMNMPGQVNSGFGVMRPLADRPAVTADGGRGPHPAPDHHRLPVHAEALREGHAYRGDQGLTPQTGPVPRAHPPLRDGTGPQATPRTTGSTKRRVHQHGDTG